jgi:hypothetical protein
MVLSIFRKIPKMYLILDRTNWKFGKKDINHLVLTATIGSVTVPLFWSLLEHQGCSDASQRIHLLEQFKETFGLDCILSFTADREFVVICSNVKKPNKVLQIYCLRWQIGVSRKGHISKLVKV